MSKSMGDLADYLYSGNRSEEGRHEPGHTTTRAGTAVGDSSAGSVMVVLSDDTTQPEDGIDRGTAVELPTTVNVRAGDRVIVTLVGGTLKSPHVSGVIGRGDELASDVADAAALAGAAKAVADATAQNFWSDSDGAHVTQATQAEWQASHAGPNSLWNSLGMLFRDGLTNLLGVLSGTVPGQRGIAVYDGEGNDATDIVASFTGAGSVIGKTTAQNVEIASGTISFRDALYTIVKIFNGSATAGFDFMAGGGMMTGFLRGGKNEQLMWLHGNDRVCLGTISGANPMSEQVQIDDGGVTFKGSAGLNVYIDLGDGSAGSGGRIVASKLGDTPVAMIKHVAASTPWAYLAGTAGSANFCRWRCKGGAVFVEAYFESAAGISAYSARHCGNVPAPYRPDHEVDAAGYPGSQAGATNSVIWVQADGGVYINCTNGQAYDKFYGSVSYPRQD